MKPSRDWRVTKSGVRRNGEWYICQYPTGYYLYGGKKYKSFGPFTTLSDAVKKHAGLKV